jgi:MoxR-like ATPase
MGLSVDEVQAAGKRVLDEVERVVVGKRDALEMVLIAVLAGGHVLIEDFPGLAKTLIARSFAQVLDLDFSRIQFTPDLMPADVIGSSTWDQQRGSFEFHPGPIFTHLLLGDEINRTPPKTQSALLEAMAEHQVTAEGTTRVLEPPFVVLATQNPLEYEGTYPLPEAQLDRFLFRIGIGYPSRDQEWAVLAARLGRRTPDVHLAPVLDRAAVLAMREAVEDVHVAESLGRYLVDLAAATRAKPAVDVGASPRGTLALLQASRARAALAGRDFVVPEDVKALAVAALAHRIALRPDLWVQGLRAEQVVAECLAEVPTPPAEPGPA